MQTADDTVRAGFEASRERFEGVLEFLSGEAAFRPHPWGSSTIASVVTARFGGHAVTTVHSFSRADAREWLLEDSHSRNLELLIGLRSVNDVRIWPHGREARIAFVVVPTDWTR